MRKNYVKPTLNSEEFTPEVYCASCKDKGVTTYSASCDTSGYVFSDNGNGIFDNNGVGVITGNGTDDYKNYNTAGTTCSFTIDYYPGNKNAWIIPVEEGTNIWEEVEGSYGLYKKVKSEYANMAIYGYRIETNNNSHFIANLNSKTITPNLS